MPTAATPFPEAILGLCLAWIFLAWSKRAVWMISLDRSNPPLKPLPASQAPPSGRPRVSVIIPARNEEKNIARCLEGILVQDYEPCEVIVVDDRSSDSTPEILARLGQTAARPFKVVRIEKTPPGWTGKNYALHAGSRAAGGGWLLFTDADTRHVKESVTTAVLTAEREGIDFLTLAPETESRSFWEKTVQPLAVSSLALWFARAGRVLANGQYILVKRSVYEACGGNEAVKAEVIEDVALAGKVGGAGGNVKFLNGTRLYSTRMYSSLKEIRTGWTRIFTFLFEKRPGPILHKIFLFCFFSILPFAVLLWQGTIGTWSTWYSPLLFWSSLAVSLWIIALRWQGNRRLRTDPLYAILHPLGSLVMVWILLECLWRVLFHRPSVWRGDLYR